MSDLVNLMNNEGIKMLSVIVPVYQAEKYIEKCVYSILDQSINDIQIVLVDDGSCDMSGKKCDYLASKDDRIIAIHTENRGPFLTRKYGVLHSTGEIITFVDADDWLDDGSYTELLELWNKFRPDILMWNYRYNEDGEIVRHLYESGLYDRNEIQSNIIHDMMWNIRNGGRTIDPSLCCKFIRRELYLEITKEIDERITLGEDAIVTYPALCLAKSILITNKAYYHYRVHKDSCVRNYSQDKICELMNFKKNIMILLSKYCKKEQFSYQIDCYLRSFLQPIINNWLGCDLSSQKFMLPYKTIKGLNCVKLYGAGEVGRCYRRSFEMTDYVDVIGWYDKGVKTGVMMIEGFEVKPAYAIVDNPDIPVLIAVQKETIALEIKKELIEMGIMEHIIIWGFPVLIG